MSLIGQTVWIVGGVGVVGRGIARGLLQAGATVIVNSRSEERLDRILNDLQHPTRLIAIHGSLQPEQAKDTVDRALQEPELSGKGLDHVVAHGAVRYWSTLQAGCDETFSLTKPTTNFLELSPEEFMTASSTLARMHFAAAQQLVPQLQKPKIDPTSLDNPNSMIQSTYTFVTGDGGGHPSSLRTPMGELNSHHVWGLSAALRRSLQNDPSVWMRELRVGMQVNRPLDVREADPRTRPLSEDIGDLMAGLVVTAQEKSGGSTTTSKFLRTYAQEKADGLIRIDSRADLDRLLKEYKADSDKNIGPLPTFAEFAGSL
ncbi:NADP oxidoreductase coenzyme F420-dependent [Nitzschia inconspicua]|uniref:NADP oxidoreductase coenzyme F420-dependent n=1 Tax=Nitzschia inconspicua TaxID=303405 RepID=A0A9K3Q3Y1_9STRA|nr:NADP oxidoreductase coenzyme F420-dependent [Nitzschia inconspicua]